MQYFRFLPDPAKLRKKDRWSGVSSVPDLTEEFPPFSNVLVTGGSDPHLPLICQYPAHFLKHSPWLVVAIVSKAL
jgi:hypothetical protein